MGLVTGTGITLEYGMCCVCKPFDARARSSDNSNAESSNTGYYKALHCYCGEHLRCPDFLDESGQS